MALAKTALKAAIKQIMVDMQKKTQNPEAAQEEFATKMADAIDAFVKTATVTVTAPIPVQVVPATGTGATTAPGTGTIS